MEALTSSSAHGVEEFGVVLGLLDLVHQEFGRFEVVHGIEELAQDPYLLKHFLLQEQFFLAGSGTIDIDGRPDAFGKQALTAFVVRNAAR